MAATAAPAVLRGQSLPPLPARLPAVGVTGAGALGGRLLPGGRSGPPHLRRLHPAGTILDAQRVLVCSESQFGAPGRSWTGRRGASSPWTPGPAIRSSSRPGSPPATARRALDGGVQLFCAQSPAFLNGHNNPQAVTAPLPPVGHPLGILINNAFGRLWFPSPPGLGGAGTD